MTDMANPLLQPWPDSRGLPPFDQIEPEHFVPAFEAALAENRVEIDAIANIPAPADFENTIAALERSGRLLRKVAPTFFNLNGAHTNPQLQAIEREIVPRLTRHRNETMFNRALFDRIVALVDAGEAAGLDAEQARVLERYHTAFVRAGAGLSEAERARMDEITQRLAALGTRFAQNILADESAFALILEDEADCAGLPDFVRTAAREAAAERGQANGMAITLSRSLIEPFLQFSRRRDLREAAFSAWSDRGRSGGKTDNRKILTETLKLRAERARLLGYETFARFKLDDAMAKTPEAVRDLLGAVWKPARARAEAERAKLQDLARADGVNDPLAPWDWRYYAEKLRSAEHDIDEAEVKPYFQLDRMIEAAFDTAGRLFGLSFAPVQDLKLYHPDVRVFDVTDSAGRLVGLFIGDYFARPSKRSGAWMTAYRTQEKSDRPVTPIIVNVMNFAKGADGEATLLTFDDARTLFHEFGHALHGLMSDVTYPMIAGTNVARDFVELPSQLFEHWLSEPEVLGRFARHYRTDEPMPADLLERLLAAENFNQGFLTSEYLASAIADLDLHDRADPGDIDCDAEEASILARIGMPEAITMRHRLAHFGHAFAGDGYSAGYYSYMWSEVMDADAFDAFREAGDIFDPDTARRLATSIYSAGGRQDPADAYRAYRGKLPEIGPLLRNRGLNAGG